MMKKNIGSWNNCRLQYQRKKMGFKLIVEMNLKKMMGIKLTVDLDRWEKNILGFEIIVDYDMKEKKWVLS